MSETRGPVRRRTGADGEERVGWRSGASTLTPRRRGCRRQPLTNGHHPKQKARGTRAARWREIRACNSFDRCNTHSSKTFS